MDTQLAKAVHKAAIGYNLALTPDMARSLVDYRIDYARGVTKSYQVAMDRFELAHKSGWNDKQFAFMAEATSTLDRQVGVDLTESRKKMRQLITDAYRAKKDVEAAFKHEADIRSAAEANELKQSRAEFAKRLASVLAEQPNRDAEQREKTAASKLTTARTLLAKNKSAGLKMLEVLVRDFEGTAAAAEAKKLLSDK